MNSHRTMASRKLTFTVKETGWRNINDAIEDTPKHPDPDALRAFVIFDYGNCDVVTPVSQDSINFYTSFYASRSRRRWFFPSPQTTPLF